MRKGTSTHWHQPLYMIFDSETMPDWLGMPVDSDLPSTYSVEYVRAWQRAGVDTKQGGNSTARAEDYGCFGGVIWRWMSWVRVWSSLSFSGRALARSLDSAMSSARW